jgi:predicted RNA-binding Zn ribbon-like protein
LRDFLNTWGLRDEADRLRRTRDLGDWLAAHGILPSGTELTKDDLARARDLRSGLRAVAAANAGRDVDETAVARLDEVARQAAPRIRFDHRGAGRFETLGKTFAEALGTLIGIVLKAQIEGRLRRFKTCDRAACRAVYYDASKAGNGRWCTARCGDRIRAQVYRKSPKYKNRGARGLR